MKPILLSMQAFGPFPKQEVINFSRLGEHPLFLINGPTGAGKTTLLDAISYALFGKTTGAERQGEQMRCHHANEETATRVDFIFSLGKNLYRVQRLPAQRRPKLRGEGFKDDPATATLWQLKAGVTPQLALDDDDMTLMASRKVRDVTQRVEQLIGLQADQFRQVVVLPQGKFRELLTADAGQREEIFAQLFQTHRYLLIEDKLKDAARELKQRVTDHEANLKSLLSNAGVESEQQLRDNIKQQTDALAVALNAKTDAAATLTKQQQNYQQALRLTQQFESQQQLQDQLTRLDREQAAIDDKRAQLQRARAAHHVTPYAQRCDWLQEEHTRVVQQLESNEAEHAALLTKRQQTEENYQRAEKQNQANANLQRRIEQLVSWRPKLDSLHTLQLQQTDLHDKQQAQQREIGEQQKHKSSLSKQIEADIEQRHALGEAISKHQPIETLEQQLQRSTEQQQKLAELIKKRETLDAQCLSLTEELSAQRQQTQRAESHAQRLEEQWYQQQAISLAKTLRPDIPCPVCGSAEHPSPAQSVAESLVEHQQIIDARQAYQRHQQLQQQIEQNLLQNKQAREFVETQIADLGAVKTASELDNEKRALAKVADQQRAEKRQYQALETRITESQQRLNSASNTLAQLTDGLQTTAIKAAQINERLQNLEQEIPQGFRSLAQVEQTLADLENALQQNQQQLKQAADKRQQLLEQLAAASAKSNDLAEQKRDLEKQAKTAETQLHEQLKRYDFADRDAYQQALLPDSTHQTYEQEIHAFQQQRAKVSSLLDEVTSQLAGQQQPDLDALKRQLSESEHQYQQANDAWLDMRDRVREFETVLKNVNNSKKQAEELHKQYAIQGTLADVAGGQNAQRLSLHRFVLSVLLDDVLTVASLRLEKMTHGRYQLLRESEVADARSAGGLTILVEDAYTGQQRSTKTLSGGEGFMAALALALGLSDVVQSYAGGIKLDTLFVDEGFGSLDDEALDMAIDTLAELRASGRTIGIISHVRELKDRLHDRIDVIRERNGSRIELRTN